VDYQRAIDHLFGLQQFGVKLGLDNIRLLLDRLGHPERQYGVVHIGGTNGKGSTAAALAEILIQAGIPVGLYTSPHLHSFTERIQVNGQAIDQKDVARLTLEIRTLGKEIPATFFEFTTAMALEYFREQKVEIAVAEVGMGGRLDATNAVDPWICVISSICLDHAEHLGRDLSAVAREKAGILKPTVPVVCAGQEPEVSAVLEERAKTLDSPLYRFGEDFSVSTDASGFAYHGLDGNLANLRPGLAGVHQWENLSLALCAAELLTRRGMSIPETALRKGIAKVRWPGRLEWWPGRVLLDGAHNGGGAKCLGAYLETLKPAKVHWVIGMKGDKNIVEILAPLAPFVRNLYCTEPPVETPHPAKKIAEEAERMGLTALVCPDPQEAYRRAVGDRRGRDVVLVAGSLFLVSVLRSHLLDGAGKPPRGEAAGSPVVGASPRRGVV